MCAGLKGTIQCPPPPPPTLTVPLPSNQQFFFLSKAGFSDVAVDCDVEEMSVHIAKTFIPGFRLTDLRLLDPDCEPTKSENISHVTITTSLIGCGTTVEHTEENVIYRNVVKDGYARNAIIGRLQVC